MDVGYRAVHASLFTVTSPTCPATSGWPGRRHGRREKYAVPGHLGCPVSKRTILTRAPLHTVP